ncbi:MAG TPA: hypothetical protein ENG03_04560 [Thioploca sp.]|nr:MAG: hypothetical protein B6247_00085 [Beggiatoa sp. 4572_84]RKZ62207.1 MAG: hypothetical protein DRR08_06720 [Gammaproteobacteria bacterium]HDN26359.1 hypothetical protein [Thioploca sp.]
MNTTAKTALTVMFCFIVALVIILTFAIYHILENGDEEIKKYRKEEIERVRQSLKDYVDIAYATIDVNYQNARDKAFLEKYYGRRLTNIVDVAENILNSKAEAVKKGKLTLSEAQAQAAAEISKLRYDNGKGYVWINDTTLPYPKMIMHPTEPSLEAQILDAPKYNVASNKKQNLYAAAVEISQAHGKGFVDYLPKQTTDGPLPKLMLAYVRLFQNWNWIIGTAVYVEDDATKDAIEKSEKDIRQMRYNNGEGYFWISSASKSDLKMIVHPTMPSLEGKILQGKLRTLYESFVEICEKPNGSGFWDHQEPKPTVGGLTSEAPKKSYMRLYEPLGWIVGTGVYIDSIEKAVAEKQELVKEQINSLILKLVFASIFIVLLISVLSYILSQYFPPEKPPRVSRLQRAPVQPAPTAAPGEYTPVDQKIPVAISTPSQAMLPTNECIKMIEKVSKTLIEQQTKLLAAVMMQKVPKTGEKEDEEEEQELELATEIKNLASKNSQTIEELKKLVEAKQQPQEANQPPHDAVNTVEIGKFNKVMNNLNKMVG